MKIYFLINKEDNHSVKWVKYFQDKGEKIYLADIQRYGLKFLEILLNLRRVKKEIRKINPDILHAHYAGVNGVLGALTGFHPFILTAHGSDILIVPKSRIVRPLIKFVLKKADLITCDARHMKEAVIKLGADPSKIKIIYFGVDTKKFSPASKSQKIKDKLEIFDSPLVISLRNLEPVYDIKSLIKAAPLVLKEIPKTEFIIAGQGSEKQPLKKLAKDLNVLTSIRFTGWIPEEETPEYLRTADVYVSTSLSDAGLASSTAEAMSCGLPVVITDFGDNKDWVKQGKGGFLIPLKDPQALAEKVIYLLKNKELRKKFGLFNREIIKKRNNYYKEMEKVENIYQRYKKNK